jgi:hypothetical protein
MIVILVIEKSILQKYNIKKGVGSNCCKGLYKNIIL